MLTVRQKLDARRVQETRLIDLETGKTKFSDPNEIKWFINVYSKMPPYEKEEIQNQWNEYYRECAKSLEAQLLREIKDAYKTDSVRFSSLVDQAHQMLKNGVLRIKRPSGYDPEIWNNAQWAHEWRMLKSQLKDEFDQEVGEQVEKGGEAW